MRSFSIILIVALGAVAYANTFHCPFHFDDDLSIVDNPFIKDIADLHGIWGFWPCRFLTYFSFAFNYHLHGLDVFGYHLFNLIVHLLSGILVWWLVLLTLSTPAIKTNKISRHADLVALFAGLVFIAHPLQTQAVTYIVQRAGSMAALFYLACLCFYVRSRLEDGKSGGFYYAFAFIMAVAAMFTKENTITLPLMVLLYEFTFLRTAKNIDWKYTFPFLLTIFIIPLTMALTGSVNFQEMHRNAEPAAGISSVHYLLTEFRVMVTYIRLGLFPVHQNLDYDYHVSQSIFEVPTLASFLFLTVVLLGARRLFSEYRLVSFAVFFFFLALLPESGLVPIKDVIFEHRLYLPLAGYSIFLVSAIYYLGGCNHLKAMTAALIIIVACYTVLTYQRNEVWKDDLALWNDTVGKSPHKPRPYNNRGNAYLKQGRLDCAFSDFNKTIELDPGYAQAYNSRSIIYTQRGDFKDAMADLGRAIALSPGDPKAYYNMGLTYSREGDLPRAVSAFSKAVALDHFYADAYVNRGLIFFKLRRFDQAFLDLTRAIEIDPGDAQAYNDRGSVYGQTGNFTKAIADFNKAIAVDPSYSQAYYNRAGTYYLLRRFH